MVIASILVFSIAYWTLMAPTMDLVTWALTQNLAPQARSTINLAVKISAWSGVIVVIGYVAWAFVSARKREYVDFRV